MIALALLLLAAGEQEELGQQLLQVKRVYIDRLNGGDTAMQIRDMLISSLLSAKVFVITENQERADAFLRGSGEDLVFTDTYQSSEGINGHMNASVGSLSNSVSASTNAAGTTRTARTGPTAGISIGETESQRTVERKHEASVSVRLVNKDGDVIWSTTQESQGGKFRGASADVADKVMKRLIEDMEKARKTKAKPSAAAS